HRDGTGRTAVRAAPGGLPDELRGGPRTRPASRLVGCCRCQGHHRRGGDPAAEVGMRTVALALAAALLAACSPAEATRTVTVFAAAALTEIRSEEHTSELHSRENLVCRLLLEKKK